MARGHLRFQGLWNRLQQFSRPSQDFPDAAPARATTPWGHHRRMRRRRV